MIAAGSLTSAPGPLVRTAWLLRGGAASSRGGGAGSGSAPGRFRAGFLAPFGLPPACAGWVRWLNGFRGSARRGIGAPAGPQDGVERKTCAGDLALPEWWHSLLCSSAQLVSLLGHRAMHKFDKPSSSRALRNMAARAPAPTTLPRMVRAAASVVPTVVAVALRRFVTQRM